MTMTTVGDDERKLVGRAGAWPHGGVFSVRQQERAAGGQDESRGRDGHAWRQHGGVRVRRCMGGARQGTFGEGWSGTKRWDRTVRDSGQGSHREATQAPPRRTGGRAEHRPTPVHTTHRHSCRACALLSGRCGKIGKLCHRSQTSTYAQWAADTLHDSVRV